MVVILLLNRISAFKSTSFSKPLISEIAPICIFPRYKTGYNVQILFETLTNLMLAKFEKSWV
jgi:hypothetical protein